MRGILAALLLAAAAQPAAPQFDPASPVDVATLMLARVRLAANREFQRLPNCTCTMNVERSRRVAGRGRFEFVDNLRLEVALVDGKEVYSWPGARQFDDRELVDIVGGGAIGSGEFAGHARNVILSGSTRLEYKGEEDLAGRQVHRFDYLVPMADSRYIMRIGQVTAAVGYRGSFWADVGTFQLRRLLVEVFDVPPQIPLERGSIQIDYEKRTISSGEFLLPDASESSLTTRGGLETRNRTTYTSCRLYSGESSLIFDEPEEEETPEPTPAPVIDWVLPKDLKVTLRPTAAQPAEKLAIGDTIEFTVWRDAAQRREVWLPRGALVRMRVTYLRCVEAPISGCVLGLHPDTFETGNKSGRFVAEREEPPLTSMIAAMGPATRSMTLSLRLADASTAEGSSLLIFRGRQLNANFQTVWRTLEVPGAQDP
ncbi:MAG: hypothetical protein KJZ84_09605 [Bryobacteraceae bacterium]|nr:hypothetical protein [Bryobacteraceae bacterium]